MTHLDWGALLRRPPTYIAHNGALARACSRWKCCEALALDTEFERTRTYYPRLGLIQVCDGETVSLIDPLALSQFEPFLEVLRAPNVLKILHASSEDLDVLQRLGSTLPRPLFDTQLAAPFAGYGYAPGYQRLVYRLFSVEITKAETRSNWLQRPFTQRQLIYAAQDVIYLLPLYRVLRQRLRANGRDEWAKEEFERALARRRFDANSNSIFRRIPHAWELEPRSLEVLRRLCVWREEQARNLDSPRRFILQDAVLLEIARRNPTSPRALKTVSGMPATVMAHQGGMLISLIQEALAVPENELPTALPNPAETRGYAALIRKLKTIVLEKSAELNVPPQILAHARLLESLVRRAAAGLYQLPQELQGWRKEVIGDALLAVLRTSQNEERDSAA